MRKRPHAICACGCGRAVKEHRNKYYTTACIPKEIRANACRAGRRAYSAQRRRELFQDALQRLGPRVTRTDLLAVLMSVYQTGYARGYSACAKKQAWRQAKADAA